MSDERAAAAAPEMMERRRSVCRGVHVSAGSPTAATTVAASASRLAGQPCEITGCPRAVPDSHCNGSRTRRTMPHFASTSLLDLETRLFATDPSSAPLRALAFARSAPPRPPRPASLKPMAFVPRPPEWQRFPNGIGCEAVLLRTDHESITTTIAAQAA